MPKFEALFLQRRRIVWGDTDPAGIVYMPRIAHFVAEGIENWFHERLSVDWTINGPHTPFASLSCSFLSPMRPADMIDVRVSLRRIGRSSLEFGIVGTMAKDNHLCWKAETVCVFVDTEKLKSRPVPEELHSRLQAEAALASRFLDL